MSGGAGNIVESQGFSGIEYPSGSGIYPFGNYFFQNDMHNGGNYNNLQKGLPQPYNPSEENAASPTVIYLEGLQSHTSIDLEFLFGIIDTWDGGYPDGVTYPSVHDWIGDYFNIKLDDSLIFSQAYHSYPKDSNGWGPWFDDGALNVADAWYEMAFTGIPHTFSNLTIEFYASGFGWQGGADESFILDNISVSLDTEGPPEPVPEPATMLLLGSGLIGLAAFRRKIFKKC